MKLSNLVTQAISLFSRPIPVAVSTRYLFKKGALHSVMTERPLRSFFEKDKGGRSREITVTDKEFYAFCSSLISGKGETDSLFGNIRKDSANKWLSRRLCRLGITVPSEKTVGCKAIQKSGNH